MIIGDLMLTLILIS